MSTCSGTSPCTTCRSWTSCSARSPDGRGDRHGHVPGQPENMAYLTCFFEDNLIAHFHVNWLAPVKIRRTLIGGCEKMIVWDDMELSEKLKIYDKGITLNNGPEGVYQLQVGYRAGDMWAPHIPNVEALQVEAQHFIDCINQGKAPDSDGHAGLRVVRVLEAASQSMANMASPSSSNWKEYLS